MGVHRTLYKSCKLLPPLCVFLHLFFVYVSGFGSMAPISAAFGPDGFFCAIDASGKQEVICWGKNSSSLSPSSSSSTSIFSVDIPAMAALSGGEGFLCGILSNTSHAYCWDSINPGTDLVPLVFRATAYSHIAAGKSHVCAIRGSYYSDGDLGPVDCWDISRDSINNKSLSSKQSSLFYNQSIASLVFKRVVSGEGFSCAELRDGGILCWGPNSTNLDVPNVSEKFVALAAGQDAVCGISEVSGGVKCWGSADSFVGLPETAGYVTLTAGERHFCGIRRDTHEVDCWGSLNSSLIPKNTGFMTIASSDRAICGIREDNLVLDCWFSHSPEAPPGYDPPLELCSPGLCAPGPCREGEFSFNASILNEPDLKSLCVRKDLNICIRCGLNCSDGHFLSSPCTLNSDRICTACSLCQNSSCWDTCGVPSSPETKQTHWHQWRRILLIVGGSVAGLVLILLGWCVHTRIIGSKKDGSGSKKHHNSELETGTETDSCAPLVPLCPGIPQIFRLSELKDATNGFKEFNEVGRGRYGFVYKAVLGDGQQVAVKRANAATIIHTNSRDFEMELDILCKIRHCNIVNLLGYCCEMGERLLVYEFMPHGTLHDHLHGGLSPLNWSLRFKIAMQAARGLEYLHNELVPPLVHQNVKTSNILLDFHWGARIADFGLIASNDDNDDAGADLTRDVYDFGIVLLEIISGRKGYDRDYTPSSIVEWAVPLIKQGKAAAIIDRYAILPRNVEPLLKLADIAELAVRGNPSKRPTISDIASWLDQIVKDGLIL
ncbi:serine/threonine-protein kinase-like protein CCR1 isoform X1 [Cucurbita maxima]|uniref:non-specific serine/threonine protein kinase n=2 Tax=Cucurbita maxima TaxID=3661 RepID=A0A6J1IMV9_CUCMA|nr:serine/threonine-protein kinase-like protein CCR1 isoform X1 [Cucurbita maxima]